MAILNHMAHIKETSEDLCKYYASVYMTLITWCVSVRVYLMSRLRCTKHSYSIMNACFNIIMRLCPYSIHLDSTSMCAQTIFSALDFLTAWVIAKNKTVVVQKSKGFSQQGMQLSNGVCGILCCATI